MGNKIEHGRGPKRVVLCKAAEEDAIKATDALLSAKREEVNAVIKQMEESMASQQGKSLSTQAGTPTLERRGFIQSVKYVNHSLVNA